LRVEDIDNIEVRGEVNIEGVQRAQTLKMVNKRGTGVIEEMKIETLKEIIPNTHLRHLKIEEAIELQDLNSIFTSFSNLVVCSVRLQTFLTIFPVTLPPKLKFLIIDLDDYTGDHPESMK
jgi:hypothetical protein